MSWSYTNSAGHEIIRDGEEQFVVQIIEDETGKVEYQSKPTYRRRAEKIEDGMGINLNWEHFSTRIIPASEVEA